MLCPGQVHSCPVRSIQVHSCPVRSIQVHSGPFSLFLSLTWTWSRHYNHSATTTTHRKLFRGLEMSYSLVWYTVGTISSSPTQFHIEIIGLTRVQHSVIGLVDIFKLLNLKDKKRDKQKSSVRCYWNHQIKPDTELIGLI